EPDPPQCGDRLSDRGVLPALRHHRRIVRRLLRKQAYRHGASLARRNHADLCLACGITTVTPAAARRNSCPAPAARAGSGASLPPPPGDASPPHDRPDHGSSRRTLPPTDTAL